MTIATSLNSKTMFGDLPMHILSDLLIAPPNAFLYTREFTTLAGKTIQLRPARAADRAAIMANIDSVCAEEVYLQTDAFKLTPEWTCLLAIDGVDRARGELLLVTEAEGHVIGHGRIYPGAYGSKDRHVAQLGIALIKAYRDQGIGTAMVQYMVDWCAGVGYLKISVDVIATNARALHVFAKLGFECEGRKKRQLFIRGRYEDEEMLSIFIEGEGEQNVKTG